MPTPSHVFQIGTTKISPLPFVNLLRRLIFYHLSIAVDQLTQKFSSGELVMFPVKGLQTIAAKAQREMIVNICQLSTRLPNYDSIGRIFKGYQDKGVNTRKPLPQRPTEMKPNMVTTLRWLLCPYLINHVQVLFDLVALAFHCFINLYCILYI